MSDTFYEEESPYDLQVGSWIRDYQLCEKFKCLIKPGGLEDQNPHWSDAMHIIISEISSYEAELSKDRPK